MARIKDLKDLTLKDMMFNVVVYGGLADGLIEMPVPQYIRIDGKTFLVPDDLDEFQDKLVYGQRLFMAQKEDNDFGTIIRVMDGYYYTLWTHKPWNAENAIKFGARLMECKLIDIYPVAMNLIKLLGEMSENEMKLLHREPSKLELAAGIEKLNVFAELTALDFLRDTMKITIEEVLLTPYKECLVRFMLAKETEQYKERYVELINEINKPKPKYHQE